MGSQERRHAQHLAKIAGEEPQHLDFPGIGWTAVFESEVAALRVAYHYKNNDVDAGKSENLNAWYVSVR